MAKFIYRMQSLLNIQYQLESQAKMELGRAQMRLNEEEEKLQILIGRKEACGRSKEDAAGSDAGTQDA